MAEHTRKTRNKWNYLWIVQGYYRRWEDLCASESYTEARHDLRAYYENEPQHAHRLIKRRELNEVPA